MADDGKSNESGQPLFHLRRIGPQATKSEVVDRMDFYKVTSLIGRNVDQVDFLLDSSNHIQRLCLSRCHARVVLQGMNQHRLYDDSLNGVFVNNIKIAGSCLLREGDRVTFGHPSGSKLPCGSRARQPDSEHQFLFEKCNCTDSLRKEVESNSNGAKSDVECGFKVPSGQLPAANHLKKRERAPTQSFNQEDIKQLKKAYEEKETSKMEMERADRDEDSLKQPDQSDESALETIPANVSSRCELTTTVEDPCDNKDAENGATESTGNSELSGNQESRENLELTENLESARNLELTRKPEIIENLEITGMNTKITMCANTQPSVYNKNLSLCENTGDVQDSGKNWAKSCDSSNLEENESDIQTDTSDKNSPKIPNKLEEAVENIMQDLATIRNIVESPSKSSDNTSVQVKLPTKSPTKDACIQTSQSLYSKVEKDNESESAMDIEDFTGSNTVEMPSNESKKELSSVENQLLIAPSDIQDTICTSEDKDEEEPCLLITKNNEHELTDLSDLLTHEEESECVYNETEPHCEGAKSKDSEKDSYLCRPNLKKHEQEIADVSETLPHGEDSEHIYEAESDFESASKEDSDKDSYECVVMTHKEHHDELLADDPPKSEDNNMSYFLSDSIDYDYDEVDDGVSSTTSEDVDSEQQMEVCEPDNDTLIDEEMSESTERQHISGTKKGSGIISMTSTTDTSECGANIKTGDSELPECGVEITTKTTETSELGVEVSTNKTSKSGTEIQTHTTETSECSTEIFLESDLLGKSEEKNEMLSETNTMETEESENESFTNDNEMLVDTETENTNTVEHIGKEDSYKTMRTSDTCMSDTKNVSETPDETSETRDIIINLETSEETRDESLVSSDVARDVTTKQSDMEMAKRIEEISDPLVFHTKDYIVTEEESDNNDITSQTPVELGHEEKDVDLDVVTFSVQAVESQQEEQNNQTADHDNMKIEHKVYNESDDKMEASVNSDTKVSKMEDGCFDENQGKGSNDINIAVDDAQTCERETYDKERENDMCSRSKRKAKDFEESEIQSRRECLVERECDSHDLDKESEKGNKEKTSKNGLSKVAKVVKGFFKKWSSKKNYSLKDTSKQSYIYAEDGQGVYHLLDFDTGYASAESKLQEDATTPISKLRSQSTSLNNTKEKKSEGVSEYINDIEEIENVELDKQSIIHKIECETDNPDVCKTEENVEHDGESMEHETEQKSDKISDPIVENAGENHEHECAEQTTLTRNIMTDSPLNPHILPKVECEVYEENLSHTADTKDNIDSEDDADIRVDASDKDDTNDASDAKDSADAKDGVDAKNDDDEGTVQSDVMNGNEGSDKSHANEEDSNIDEQMESADNNNKCTSKDFLSQPMSAGTGIKRNTDSTPPHGPVTPEKLYDKIVESSQLSSPVIDKVGVVYFATSAAQSPIVPKQDCGKIIRNSDEDITIQENITSNKEELTDIEPLSCTFSDNSVDCVTHPDIDFTCLNSPAEKDVDDDVICVNDEENDASNEDEMDKRMEELTSDEAEGSESDCFRDSDRDSFYRAEEDDRMDYFDEESDMGFLSDEHIDYRVQDSGDEVDLTCDFDENDKEKKKQTSPEDHDHTSMDIENTCFPLKDEKQKHKHNVKRKCDFTGESSPKRPKSTENVEIDGLFEIPVCSPKIEITDDVTDVTVESDGISSTQLLNCTQTPNMTDISYTQMGEIEDQLMEKMNDPERSKSTKSKAKDLLAKLKAKRRLKIEKQEDRESGAASPVPGTSGEADNVNRHRTIDEKGPTPSSDDVEKHLHRVQEVVCQLKRSFKREDALNFNPRVMAWRQELAEVEKKLVLPKTVIAVVGDTGSGKSSLMNALLDHRSVLPTSGMRACTAVVVQVVLNTTSKQFEADIEFLQPKEWFDELQILLRDLTGLDGQIKKGQPDPASDAFVSYCKVKAVYGMIDTFKTLSRYNTVTRWLGKTKVIKSSKPEDFRCAVERYIESLDTGTGGQYWPIVKHVRLRMPSCDVCSSGAALVDLPGVRDSNAARDKIAKEYLKNCTAVWVVSSIHRAIDDKTAKDLLGENFRRQLLMDGQYGSIAFICTKTDVLMPSEIIKPLKLEDKTCVHEMRVRELEAEKSDLNLTVTRCTQKIDQLKDDVDTLKTEVEDLRDNLTEIQSLLEADNTDSEQTEETEALQEYQQELQDKETQIEAAQAESGQLNTDRQHAIQQIHVLENELTKHRRKITAICAKARNEYSKSEIRRDFKAGLKEMKRRAGMLDTEDEEEEDAEDNADEDEELGSTADNLKVFCCSSTEYQKLKNLLTDDGPAQVFSSIEDTEVPALRSYVHEMTSVRRLQALERLIRSLGRFVFDLQSYTTTGANMSGDRAGAKCVIEKQLQQLDHSLAPVLRQLQADIDTVFDGSLRPKMKEGANNATLEANNTCAKWGAPVCRDKGQDRRAGGLHFSTYRATIRRRGVYTSKTFGAVDMNEELAEPMYRSMTIVWDKAFSGMLWRVLDKLKSAIVHELQQWINTVCKQLEQIGVPRDRSNRTGAQLLGSASNKLTEMVNHLKELITERQRTISRVVTPIVQDKLTGTYEGCAAESGKGMYMRIKTLMSQGIETQKYAMFDTATNDLMQALIDLQTEIVAYVREVCQNVMADLQAAFEPLWDSPANSSSLRSAFLQPVTKACASVREIYKFAGLQNTEEKTLIQPAPLTVDQATPTVHLPHTTNTTTVSTSTQNSHSILYNGMRMKIEPQDCNQDVNAGLGTNIKQEKSDPFSTANSTTVISQLPSSTYQQPHIPKIIMASSQPAASPGGFFFYSPQCRGSISQKQIGENGVPDIAQTNTNKTLLLSQGYTQKKIHLLTPHDGTQVKVIKVPTNQTPVQNLHQKIGANKNVVVVHSTGRLGEASTVAHSASIVHNMADTVHNNKENVHSAVVPNKIKIEPKQIKTEPGESQQAKRRRKDLGLIDLTGD